MTHVSVQGLRPGHAEEHCTERVYALGAVHENKPERLQRAQGLRVKVRVIVKIRIFFNFLGILSVTRRRGERGGGDTAFDLFLRKVVDKNSFRLCKTRPIHKI